TSLVQEKRHSDARSQSQTGVYPGANLAHDASTFESRYRPPEPIGGGVSNAGDPMTPRGSPGWIGAYETHTRIRSSPSDSDGASSTRNTCAGSPSWWWTIFLI